MQSVSEINHFWPKKDNEECSRKNIFENPPCGKYVMFVTEFVILDQIFPFMK